MSISVGKNTIVFYGKFPELLALLKAYPPDTRLQDFIRLHLH
ncbi:hypothetical protein [Syntrophomonas wolfei]|nr:hypothetical protein [Syntrophomonas wolfei]